MVTFRTPVNAAVISSIGTIQPMHVAVSVSPNQPTAVIVIIAPSMKTSPWAKLISSRMP